MIIFVAAAAVVAVMLSAMVQKAAFYAERTGETIRLAFPGRCFRRPWMTAPLALVFLMPIFIFSEAIKIGLIVYFRVVDLA